MVLWLSSACTLTCSLVYMWFEFGLKDLHVVVIIGSTSFYYFIKILYLKTLFLLVLFLIE